MLLFISYRRTDSPGQAHRIADRLRAAFGDEQVFLDLRRIPPGRDFDAVLTDRLNEATAMVVVVGPLWVKDRSGRLRFRKRDDYVKKEIAAAMQRGIPVYPVLVEGASMPAEPQLPGEIASFARLQALEVPEGYFDEAMYRLEASLRPPSIPRQSRGVPPLFRCVHEGDLAEARELLTRLHLDVNERPWGDETVLHKAAGAGRRDFVELFLEAGAEVDAKDMHGMTPLARAALRGRTEVMELLIEHGADVNSRSNFNRTPLISAASEGHLEAVRVLLAHGADPNAAGYRDQTAIIEAGDRTDILRVLIDAGADVNCKDNAGNTALLLAVEGKRAAVVAVLVEAGADVQAKNNFGHSAWRLVEQDEETAALLLRGAQKIEPAEEAALLALCAAQGWLKVTDLLLGRGMDVRGPAVQNALREGVRRGHIEFVRFLLEHGADPDAGGSDPPLEWILSGPPASHERLFAMAELLLSHGADVNIDRGHPLWMALHYVAHSDPAIVEVLLAHGAKVESKHVAEAESLGLSSLLPR